MGFIGIHENISLNNGYQGHATVLIDESTGINYLAFNGGLTPLLTHGNVIKVSSKKEIQELKEKYKID